VSACPTCSQDSREYPPALLPQQPALAASQASPPAAPVHSTPASTFHAVAIGAAQVRPSLISHLSACQLLDWLEFHVTTLRGWRTQWDVS